MRVYDFSKSIYNRKVLYEIFELLDDKIEIKDKVLILPDNYEEIVGDKQKQLTKKFYTYSNKVFNKALTRTEYNQWQEALRKKELEKQKQIELEQKRLKDEEECMLKFKVQYKDKWRNKDWIDNNIGVYYNWAPCIEYYWTVIGDRYRLFGNGDVQISESARNDILSLGREYLIPGKTFLGRSFKRKDRRGSHYIVQDTYANQQKEKPQSYGVYGIYKDDELIYVGSTMREFDIRFKEHLKNINEKSTELYLYSLLNKNDNIYFVKFIDVAQLKTNRELGRQDVEAMELALISVYKPRGNLAGNSYEFKFT